MFSNLAGNKLENNKSIYTIEDLISEEPLIPTVSLLFRNKVPFILPDWFNTIINTDMALFILICGKSKIKYFEECWSVYRKHNGGVSINIAGDFKHSSRIKMFILIMNYLRGAYKKSFVKILRFHLIKLRDFSGLSLHDKWVMFNLFPFLFLKKWVNS